MICGRTVRIALRAKTKLGFIDAMLGRPNEKGNEDFTECHVWDMVNSMLCSWMLNIIDPKLRMSIAHSETAKTMWGDLKKRYGMPNTPKAHQFKSQYYELQARRFGCWRVLFKVDELVD